jgi:hypothetical protein
MYSLFREIPLRFWCAALALSTLVGCRKPMVRVYLAPKDSASANTPAPAIDSEPQISWTLPTGWQQTAPGQMHAASFSIPGQDGGATVNITPLPNLEGREEAVVNMWREQVELGPLPAEEVAKALSPIEIAGGKGSSFEITGTRVGKVSRIVTAIFHRGGQSWFFKLAGEDAVVNAQKATFFEFVKSVRITDPPASASGSPSAAPVASTNGGAPGKFKWTVPAPWTVLAPGQMQVAKFTVPEKDSAKAEVSVSIFPNDTGGTLANVNRWRKQIGLDEVDEAGLASCTKELPGATGAVFVELTHEKRQILGAIVPRDGQYWFYKLMGDAPAVGAARDDFQRFAASTP